MASGVAPAVILPLSVHPARLELPPLDPQVASAEAGLRAERRDASVPTHRLEQRGANNGVENQLLSSYDVMLASSSFLRVGRCEDRGGRATADRSVREQLGDQRPKIRSACAARSASRASRASQTISMGISSSTSIRQA